ncbi:PIG-L deacetylase family protein [Jannaschia sp. W003]|uniref:PIG-L deacetylase family protein n=1 Tax=Jannaschia sp. W003 TaxID=2867012 RepID=UPI0021A56BFF|nr:PIG-L family deacetylase [Jannaschia sp. W003]UWQ19968.1 PIG-L family deacetylase [Jannaschia sp. W003]
MDELHVAPAPVLVLAPHADDESLGCGLLLSEIWRGGGAAHVACLTDGAASHPNSRSHPPARMARLREEEMARAVGLLGGTPGDVTFLGLPDAALHRVHGPGADLARDVTALVDRLDAGTLVAPSPLDPHCDHEAGALAARAVAAGRPGLRLLFYPVWSRWTAPGRVAPVPAGTRPFRWSRGRRHDKRAAIYAHASQMGRVVRDDPDGFAMPEGFAEAFVDAPETFFEVRP